jgi:hypothetical protein
MATYGQKVQILAHGVTFPTTVTDGTGASITVQKPLAAGMVYFYTGGTTTDLTVYSDYDLKTARSQPVNLDSDGRATVFVPSGSRFKMLVKSSAGTTIYTDDYITALADYLLGTAR